MYIENHFKEEAHLEMPPLYRQYKSSKYYILSGKNDTPVLGVLYTVSVIIYPVWIICAKDLHRLGKFWKKNYVYGHRLNVSPTNTFGKIISSKKPYLIFYFCMYFSFEYIKFIN